MSSRSGSPTASSTDGNSGGNIELIIAIVALIISVLAFAVAILQALQQFFASATGFSYCSPEVIGKWSEFCRRQMRWKEFRFEVQFDAPVIFVAKPENKKGPLGDDDHITDETRKIIRLDGSPGNFNYTSSIKEFDQEFAKSRQQVVHTADNEKATWYAMLMAICRMEKESREWQEKKLAEWRKLNGPRPPLDTASPSEPAHANHSLLVCMQRKRRTWDSMPEGLNKPYATTTISHLVEIAAMLGIYWRQFDLNYDQYRAQGNGFLLLGSYKDNLGITFSFQKQGPTWAAQNRIVPHYNVKKLCFGIAPTIFDREERVYADEPKDAGSLQLGSHAEIAQSLVALGCDMTTVNYFRKNLEQVRHTHLFPVPFEILGMIGEVLYVRNTVFRVIPNPVCFHWEPATFSLSTLLHEFITSLKNLQASGLMRDSAQLAKILEWANGNDNRLPALRASSTPDIIGDEIKGARLVSELNHLRAGIDICDDYYQRTEHSMVKKVLRVHIQEILNVLNGKDDAGSVRDSRGEDDNKGEKDRPMTINDLDSASPEDKESLLVDLYIGTIRRNVVRAVREKDSISKQRRARRASLGGNGTNANPKPSRGITEIDVNEAWLTIVFRMLCWLQLHDFHKMDIQLSKSDAYASRIPVYIV
ncbi:probable Modin [Fusarium oxysporum]|uniref:Probable Modin n=1 Tax=Fusarium oxysporum TaxID=5507 RepID=A0A2H3T1M9_FUSOX|nr:probable Modin [Fusarium oxysporum]